MTETESRPVSCGDYSNGISIETSKVVQGMGLVFSGAMTMLEAIHPKISIEPAELMCLLTGDQEGLARPGEMRREEAEKSGKTGEPREETHETKNAGTGTVDVLSATVSDAHRGDDTADDVKQKPTRPMATLTQDDITKVIVQKIKANRSSNEKIGRLLKTYGVARVSDLPASKYEAFITDLAVI